MITIDRESSVSVQAQLSDQLRYLIATGRYPIGEQLPSTRVLADQLDISYHTVRAAYRALVDEGLIQGRSGAGYTVKERSAGARGDRMEAGAAVVQDAIRKLIGHGLAADEIEYLFQEQAELLAGDGEERKLGFTSASLELATPCARQLTAALQRPVEAASLLDLDRHSDADFICASFTDVRGVMAAAPRADVRGVVVHLNPDALERIVRLMDDETLGLVARSDEAIPHLIQLIREQARFNGQLLAFSSDASAAELSRLVEQASLVAYTPASRRALLPLLKDPSVHVLIHPVISETSLKTVRQVVPY